MSVKSYHFISHHIIQPLNYTQYKPARTPSVRYRCRIDVALEPRAKPIRPRTEPVIQTTRDPYRVIATLTKIPANHSSAVMSSSANYDMHQYNNNRLKSNNIAGDFCSSFLS